MNFARLVFLSRCDCDVRGPKQNVSPALVPRYVVPRSVKTKAEPAKYLCPPPRAISRLLFLSFPDNPRPPSHLARRVAGPTIISRNRVPPRGSALAISSHVLSFFLSLFKSVASFCVGVVREYSRATLVFFTLGRTANQETTSSPWAG